MENEKKNPIVIIDAKPFIKEYTTDKVDSRKKEKKEMKQDEESIFLDLNSVLVKFWREKGGVSKDMKIRLLERMLGWYKKMGTITLNDLTLTE